MTKLKKTKKNKKIEEKPPSDVGLELEQKLADSLCDQFLQVGVDKEAIDDAFIGAFSGLANRMFGIFKKEFVLEIVEDMYRIAEEDNEPHVCNDCMEKHDSVSKTSNNKVH